MPAHRHKLGQRQGRNQRQRKQAQMERNSHEHSSPGEDDCKPESPESGSLTPVPGSPYQEDPHSDCPFNLQSQVQPSEELESSSPSPSTAPSTPERARMPPSPFLPPSACRDPQCLIQEPHQEGIYRHHGEPPGRSNMLFGESNPPPLVWRALESLEIGRDYGEETTEEFDALSSFLKLHMKGKWEERSRERQLTPQTDIEVKDEEP